MRDGRLSRRYFKVCGLKSANKFRNMDYRILFIAISLTHGAAKRRVFFFESGFAPDLWMTVVGGTNRSNYERAALSFASSTLGAVEPSPRICRASFGVATWSPNTSMILAAF